MTAWCCDVSLGEGTKGVTRFALQVGDILACSVLLPIRQRQFAHKGDWVDVVRLPPGVARATQEPSRSLGDIIHIVLLMSPARISSSPWASRLWRSSDVSKQVCFDNIVGRMTGSFEQDFLLT